MAASFHGYSHVVRVLLNNGASTSAVDELGYTALLSPSQLGHLVVTKMLMKVGSDLRRLPLVTITHRFILLCTEGTRPW